MASTAASLLLMLHAATLLVGGDPAQRYRFNISHDEIFSDNKVIPLEHQVSEFLYKGQTKMFFFYNKRREGPLSITVTPCTSSLIWSVRYRPKNDTELSRPQIERILEEFRGRETRTFTLNSARPGLYMVQVSPLERETYVHLYASLQPGGPHPLTQPHRPKLRLQKRHRRKSLTVRWEQSTVDPHLMHYCLVVNTRRYYSTLCEARGERYGVIPPDASNRSGFNFPHEQMVVQKLEVAQKADRLNASRLGRGSGAGTGTIHEDIVIGCVGRKTQYTLCDLEHGKVYHFNLFAVNKRTNLSFPYGSTTLKYEQKNRPAGLRDGKTMTVNLKQLDGRATFKFKVGKKVSSTPGSAVQLAVMPCGGAVDVKVKLKQQVVVAKQRVDGYERFSLNSPAAGQRYVIHVTAPNVEELRRISGLEMLAMTQPTSKFPLPLLPSSTQLHEYDSLRRCDSVTVGWVPSPEPAVRYCILAREARPLDLETGRRPNQCGLEGRLRKSSDFVVRMCQQRQENIKPANVTTHVIRKLKPGRSYTVQVTVQKIGAKMLSYDLLQVHTKPKCT
ncbi:protein NDNF [Anabrus simplex]|uniref:protein NDNF n=1 Tax=Anabrus simplex TaxID=316456 RepID=UPI0035A2FA0E